MRAQLCPTLWTPWTVAHKAPLSWDFPGKNTEVSCHFLLQGIFPSLGLNLCLLYWQVDFFTNDPPGKPTTTFYPTSQLFYSWACTLEKLPFTTVHEDMHKNIYFSTLK